MNFRQYFLYDNKDGYDVNNDIDDDDDDDRDDVDDDNMWR